MNGKYRKFRATESQDSMPVCLNYVHTLAKQHNINSESSTYPMAEKMAVKDVNKPATWTAHTQCNQANNTDTSIMHRDVCT